jgi:hypothetical protein
VPAAIRKRGRKRGWFWEHGEEIYCEDDRAWLRTCSKCHGEKRFKAFKTTSTFHLK